MKNASAFLLKSKMHPKKMLSNKANISFLAMNGAIQSYVFCFR
jgi:hypothetical protein